MTSTPDRRGSELTTSDKRGSELTLESITKSFGGPPAVHDVSLNVEPHEFLTLLGPSGSGKTTILRMIGGFITPDSGRILIDGADVSGVPVERRPTAMLFQQLSLWPHLSVARNVSFGLELRRRPKAEIRRRVDELLSVVGLADFGDRLPSELSGGQQQRVALARAPRARAANPAARRALQRPRHQAPRRVADVRAQATAGGRNDDDFGHPRPGGSARTVGPHRRARRRPHRADRRPHRDLRHPGDDVRGRLPRRDELPGRDPHRS